MSSTMRQQTSEAANTATSEAAKEGAERDIDQLKSDMASIRDDVVSLLKDAKLYARSQTRRGVDQGRGLASEAQGQAGEAQDAFEEKIRTNPFAAVAIAAGVGFLFGVMNRR